MSSGLTGSCFGQAGEVDDPGPLGRHLQGRLLGLLGGRGDADPLGPGAAGPLQQAGQAVVVAGDPGVVDEPADRLEGELDPLARLTSLRNTRRAPRSRAMTACQQPIGPAPRISTVSPEADVQLLDPVQGAGEGVGDRGQVGRQVRREGDQVLRRDRGHGGVLGVGARETGRSRRAGGVRRGSGARRCTSGTCRR